MKDWSPISELNKRFKIHEELYFIKTRRLNKPAKIIARYSVIDINTADTTAFITLPGIGSKLAARIVNFRDKAWWILHN